MNLTLILADLYRRFDYTSSPVPSAVTTRLTAYVNSAHRELCSLPGMERLRQDVMSITAYNGISRTGLPQNVARINAITDRLNNHSLEEVPLNLLRITDPAQAFVGGYPLRYAVVSDQAVYRQPGAAAPSAAGYGLWAASSSAGDTTQHVLVESVGVGGYRLGEGTVGTVLTGTTPVQVSARTDNIEVTKFYLDAAAVGFVSLYDANGGNELARLHIGQMYSRYWAVEWFPIQQQDTTEWVDYTRQIADLVNATDEPLVPQDFHELVIMGAALREMSQIDSRYPSLKADYMTGRTAMMDFVMNSGARLATLRRTPIRWSRLGAQYPYTGMW